MKVIETVKETDMWGKKTGRWIASVGDYKVFATSREQAIAKLREKLIALTEYVGKISYITSDNGTMFVLYYNGYDWAYDIVGSGRQPTTVTCAGTRDEAWTYMLSHAEEYNN